MIFAHDTRMALGAAVALVNSAQPPDSLATVAQLREFYDTWGYTGAHVRGAAELAAVQALRPTLRALLLAERDDAVPQLNAMLAAANAVPQLVRHEGYDWHIHAITDQAPLADRITVETAMAMIDVIRADELSRLGICADDSCAGVVLDLSRNRSRRFCSTDCSNRNAVAAYRARQADLSP